MILVDANLLIYAIDVDSPHHAMARRWLEGVLSGADDVALAWGVVLAFLRVVTHPAIMCKPLPAEDALGFVDGWLAQPRVHLLAPGERHWALLSGLLRATGTAGNLTSDAHLAALAIEHGCSVASADNDFRRFPALRHVNPLTGG